VRTTPVPVLMRGKFVLKGGTRSYFSSQDRKNFGFDDSDEEPSHDF
jgi:hypothetical protein